MAKRTAKDLIAERETQARQHVPDDVLELLRGVLKHNDSLSQGSARRVSLEKVREVLREDYGLPWGTELIKRVVREHLGRGWMA